MKNLPLSLLSLNRSHMVIKKYLLSIVWCMLHTTIISIITIKIQGVSLELIWLPIVLVYVSFYLITTSIFLDKIVHNEIKNTGK